jgi:hypothetical protein
VGRCAARSRFSLYVVTMGHPCAPDAGVDTTEPVADAAEPEVAPDAGDARPTDDAGSTAGGDAGSGGTDAAMGNDVDAGVDAGHVDAGADAAIDPVSRAAIARCTHRHRTCGSRRSARRRRRNRRDRFACRRTCRIAGSDLGDIWEWDGTTWTKLAIASPPGGGSSLAYDPARSVVLLFQSNYDVWEL